MIKKKKDNVDINAAVDNNIGKSNKMVLILLTITILLVLSMCAFFGYMYINGNKASANNTTTTQQKANTKPEKTLDLDEFVINLADESPTFVKMKISIAYTDKATEKELTANIPQLRHTVNNFLWNKKSSDFNGKNFNGIVNELKNKLNTVINKGSITNIYIRDILIS